MLRGRKFLVSPDLVCYRRNFSDVYVFVLSFLPTYSCSFAWTESRKPLQTLHCTNCFPFYWFLRPCLRTGVYVSYLHSFIRRVVFKHLKHRKHVAFKYSTDVKFRLIRCCLIVNRKRYSYLFLNTIPTLFSLIFTARQTQSRLHPASWLISISALVVTRTTSSLWVASLTRLTRYHMSWWGLCLLKVAGLVRCKCGTIRRYWGFAFTYSTRIVQHLRSAFVVVALCYECHDTTN